MKRLGKIAVSLAVGLALDAGLCAADTAPANNAPQDDPYSVVVARNIFGLLPPPAPPDPNQKVEETLPKISPTGIMTVFGHSKVLFKVAGAAKSGQTAKDEYYDLSEGEAQEEIEVSKIDEKNGLVTFINHGIEQALPLVNAPASGGPAAAGGQTAPTGAPSPGLPGLRNPGLGNPGGVINFGSGRLGVHMSGANPGSANNGVPVGFGNADPSSYVPPQQQNTLPADTRIILMEAQRAQWQTANNPALNPAFIPPTPLTSLNKPDGEADVPAP